MIRSTRNVIECVCVNCKIIHLLGETFNGQRCCDDPNPRRIGEREIVEYTKSNSEEKQEVLNEMKMPNHYEFHSRLPK